MTNFSRVLLIAFILNCLLSSMLFAKPYRFAVTNVSGLEELHRDFEPFQKMLIDLTGLEIQLYPVSSRTAAAEALKFKKVDLVLAGPAEYLALRKRAKVTPMVTFSRPDYFSVLLVRTDSPVQSVKELKGKKIGLGEVGSTSYYLAPLQLLSDGGLNPTTDIHPHHLSKEVSWASLKRKSLDAIGFSYERYLLFRERDKDVGPEGFRILARGPQLPNDVLVAGDHVSPEVVQKLQSVFTEHSEELIKKLLVGKGNDKYESTKFMSGINEEDYDLIRKMYQTAGLKHLS